jgi:serine/threonine protein kinase
MSGQDLLDAINNRLITDNNIEEVTRDLLKGLDEIHQSGIIHADIKPDNIRFLQDPSAGTTIKYFDFGLSCVINSCSGPIRGTRGYMKPEKIAQRSKTYYEYNKTDDFYALAKTLSFCLASVQTKKPWLQGVVDRLIALDATQKATDALPPVVGGNRRTKKRSGRRSRI